MQAEPLELRVAPTPRAARAARAWIAETLHPEGAAAADLAILVTEAVTNSVRHAGLRADERIVVRARPEPCGRIRVSVCDEGGRFREPSCDTTEREGGRGLLLIDRLSDAWGVEHDGITRLWFLYDPATAAA